MSLRVKSLVITGTNRGLGLEFVRQIVKLPHPPKWLFATCRNPEQAKELQEVAALNSNVRVVKLEVTDAEDIQLLVSEVEKTVGEEGLNLLINGAGISKRVSIDNVTEDVMTEVFRVNCVAPLLLSQAFHPLLKKAASKSPMEGLSCEKAAIINMTSKMGSISDNTSGAHYAYRASKGSGSWVEDTVEGVALRETSVHGPHQAGLNMISRSLSVDLKSDGILAMALHPGWVRTDMGGPRGLLDANEAVDSLLKVIASLNEEKTGTFLNYDGTNIEW